MVYVLILLTLLSSTALAQSNVIYFGGGGEPKDKDTTIFDDGIKSLAKYSQQSKSSAEYFFTATNKTSVALATQATGSKPNEFTSDAWNKKIDRLKLEIGTGSIKGKLLLVIDTHGSDAGAEYSISTTDGSVAPEAKLKELIGLAEQKGVQLGIVFGSCSSGKLISLGTDKTCVVAASSTDQFAYKTFADTLLDQLSRTPNLEEAYLGTRSQKQLLQANAQPMISSPAGLKTSEALRVLNRFITDRDRALARAQEQKCMLPAESSLNQIAEQLGDVSDAITLLGYKIRAGTSNVDSLKTLVKEYEKIEVDYKRISAEHHPFYEFCYASPHRHQDRDIDDNDTGEHIVYICVDNFSRLESDKSGMLEELRKNLLTAADAPQAERIRTSLKELEAIKQNPKFREASMSSIKNPPLIADYEKRMSELGSQISDLELKIFDRLYKANSKELGDKPNPCANFKL